jgi:hypothetical protein
MPLEATVFLAATICEILFGAGYCINILRHCANKLTGYSKIWVLTVDMRCKMTKRSLFNAVWWHWIMLATSLLMAAEYARLILFAETATYRIFVFLIWVCISLFSVARIMHTHRQSQKNSGL